MLASTGVGIAVNNLTGWNKAPPPIYLQYNGNDGTLTPHIRLGYIEPGPCPHYPLEQAGDPVFVKV